MRLMWSLDSKQSLSCKSSMTPVIDLLAEAVWILLGGLRKP